MTRTDSNSRRKAVYVPFDKMKEYDWSNKSLASVGRKWVYYLVPRYGEKERILVRLKYDRDYDWEFEHDY